MNIIQTLSNEQFSLLRKLFPISGLIHIGAGTGSATSVYKEWGIPNALLVEADPHLLSQLKRKTMGIEGWFSLQAVVSDQATQASFYQCNNPHEHGLIEPEKLTTFWRNLKTVEVQTADTQNLASILAGMGISYPSNSTYNWLIVDCLPAASILEGIGDYLGQVDVVIARAVLSPDDSLLSAGITRVDELLKLHGYHSVQVYEENHPAVGQILYVLDHKVNIRKQRGQMITLQQAKTEADKSNSELKAHIQNLAQTNDTQTKLVNEQQQQLAELQNAKTETDKQLITLQQAKAEVDKANFELKAQTQSRAQARDEQTQLASDRQQQITALQQAKVETDKRLAALQQTKNETDKQLAALQQAKAEADKINQEFKTKEDLYHVEMAKTETQIELIKEMLLREEYL